MENKFTTFLTNDEEGNIIPTSEGNFIRGYINGLNDAGKHIHYSEYQTLFEDESENEEPVLAVDFYQGSKIENSDKQPIIFKMALIPSFDIFQQYCLKIKMFKTDICLNDEKIDKISDDYIDYFNSIRFQKYIEYRMREARNYNDFIDFILELINSVLEDVEIIKSNNFENTEIMKMEKLNIYKIHQNGI